MKNESIETKLSAARTKLILDKPFLGALVLRLPMIAAGKWCRTTATDARKFYYNLDFVEALSPEETQFILAHEALHCALSHFARRQHRIKRRWDVACDYAINPLLIRDGLTPPSGSLYHEDFEGMTAEEIYPCLESYDEETLDEHLYDSDVDGSQDQSRAIGEEQSDDEGPPKPAPLTPQERESLSVQWEQRLAGAALQAKQAGKLSGPMLRMVDFLLQPKLPWRMLLARYLTMEARDDYSYTRPSNRRGDPAIFPSLRSSQLSVVAVIDMSGSVNDKEMSEFLSEIDAIKGQLRAKITLHACDAMLDKQGPWVFDPWEEIRLPKKFRGGGGTSFIPPFEWADGLDIPPDVLIYFTDAEGEFPDQPPTYPVVWLVKGKAPVPWGQRIQLN